MAAETTRAIAYIRSATPTDSDTAQRTRIATQRISTYCRLTGVTLIEMLVDPASGGPLEARLTLQDALASLAQGKADALIVPSFGMLSRSLAELVPWLVRHFGDGSSYRLIAVAEQIDTRQPSGRLALGVLAALTRFDGGARHA